MKFAATLLLLAVTNLSASTILSVTGGTAASDPGIFPNQTVAFSFIVGQSYTNVSISPDLIGSFTGTVYLTNQIGAGTTLANEIATGSFTSTGGFDTVLQNVSFGPGTYFLVFTSAQDTPPQGLVTANGPTTVADVGASAPFGLDVSSTGNAFAPSDVFTLFNTPGQSNGTPLFTITGTSAAPEPATWTLVGAAFASLLLCRKLKNRAGA